MKQQALDDIYQMHVRDIYRYLYSLCHDHYAAEDLMQETFCRAYLYLENCTEDGIKPWLFRVAYNAFVDYTRKEKRSTVVAAGYFTGLGHHETPEKELLRREQLDELAESLALMPPNQRQALLLYEIHGLSYREASGIMEVGLSQFKILLFRGRQKLRELREKQERKSEDDQP